METSALCFFEGTLTNDNWDITIDIPEISNLNGNVSQIFQGVFADGSKPFKTYQSLRVEGMNIQRYTSYSGVKTRVIAYLKCRSLVCSSHIDFRLCRQNNHISMYNTYIQCVSLVVIHIYYQPMMLIGYSRSHVRKINVKHQPMYSRYLETQQNLFDFNIYICQYNFTNVPRKSAPQFPSSRGCLTPRFRHCGQPGDSGTQGRRPKARAEN